METVAVPELPPSTAARVVNGYQELLSSDMDFPRCLVHNDLFSDHVLLDDVAGEIAGIIDFEDASIGDPIIDLLPLANEFGVESLVDLAAGRDLGSQAPLRFWFYRWMSGIHNMIYGVTEGSDAERSSGIAEVTTRIIEPRLPEALFRAT